MNRPIWMSILSILAVVGIVGATTYAFFSSEATSTGNVFGAGTLVMQLDDDNDTTPASTITASFSSSGMIPGGTAPGFVSMHNDGSIDMAEVNLGGTETVSSSPDLADKLNIISAKIGTESTCTTSPADIVGSFTTLAALNTTDLDLPSSGITAGDTKFLCMIFQLDSLTDNTYQGKSITETFTFTGHQDLTQ